VLSASRHAPLGEERLRAEERLGALYAKVTTLRRNNELERILKLQEQVKDPTIRLRIVGICTRRNTRSSHARRPADSAAAAAAWFPPTAAAYAAAPD